MARLFQSLFAVFFRLFLLLQHPRSVDAEASTQRLSHTYQCADERTTNGLGDSPRPWDPTRLRYDRINRTAVQMCFRSPVMKDKNKKKEGTKLVGDTRRCLVIRSTCPPWDAVPQETIRQ